MNDEGKEIDTYRLKKDLVCLEADGREGWTVPAGTVSTSCEIDGFSRLMIWFGGTGVLLEDVEQNTDIFEVVEEVGS